MLALLAIVASLDVVYTANIGGEFLGCGCLGEEGGMARIAHFLNTVDHDVLIDAGGLFGKNRFVDSVAVSYLSHYGYDAILLTRGELRFGPDLLRYGNTNVPLVCANLTHDGRHLVRRYTTKETPAGRVIVTGVIEPEGDSLVQGMVLSPAREAVAEALAEAAVRPDDWVIVAWNGGSSHLRFNDRFTVPTTWRRRIGYARIDGAGVEERVVVLDSTIPEDPWTKARIEEFLDYLHTLPARPMISNFPAHVAINYYAGPEDTAGIRLLGALVKELAGATGLMTVTRPGPPMAVVGPDTLVGPEIPAQARDRVIARLRAGGDERAGAIYFRDPGCPDCQRYDLLVRAFAADHPEISIAWADDEVLLERCYAAYAVPPNQRRKPILFAGSRFFDLRGTTSRELSVEGPVPWLTIYGFLKSP